MAASNFARSGFRDEAALEELQHHRPHPLVDDQLRQDQQRHRHQKSDVQLDIVEMNGSATRVPHACPSTIDRTSNGTHARNVKTTTRRRSNCSASPTQVGSPQDLVQRPAKNQ